MTTMMKSTFLKNVKLRKVVEDLCIICNGSIFLILKAGYEERLHAKHSLGSSFDFIICFVLSLLIILAIDSNYIYIYIYINICIYSPSYPVVGLSRQEKGRIPMFSVNRTHHTR